MVMGLYFISLQEDAHGARTSCVSRSTGTHIHIAQVICSQSLMHNATLQRTDKFDRPQQNYSYLQLTYLSHSFHPCCNFDQYKNIPISLPEPHSYTQLKKKGFPQLNSSPHLMTFYYLNEQSSHTK